MAFPPVPFQEWFLRQTSTGNAALNAYVARVKSDGGIVEAIGCVPLAVWDWAAPSFVGLLDLFPNAAAAYSLRKLRAAYSGAAVRVRESGGNTEADIGFTSAGELDTTALLAHCGANDGFVTVWYDQSSSNDATQSTAADQPKIVSGGSLVTENGKAAIDFDGVNDALNKSSFNITGTSAISSFSVGFGVDSPANGVFSIQGVIGGADGYVQTTETAIRTGGGYAEFGLQSAINSSLVSTFFPSGSDISDILCFINGSSSSRIGLTDNTIDLGANTTFSFGLGAGTYFDGIVQEVILFNSDQSANRTGIETNINTFYSIY